MNGNTGFLIEHMRRAGVCAVAVIALVLASGCDDPTRVLVTLNGAPVAGAEISAENVPIGRTDANGVLTIPNGLRPGTALVARKQIFERPGFRANHGTENGGLSWTERVYLTSVDINNDGTFSPPLRVIDPDEQQTLILKTDNVLIGVHFMVSVIWDASDAELQDVAERFRQASDFIHNATDGQIYFEQIDIVDDNTFWNDAEFHWHADTAVWPTASNLGGLLFPNVFGGAVEMSRNTQRPNGSDAGKSGFRTIAHEFGHLGLGLMDEHSPSGAFCTSNLQSRFVTPFGANMPKASCVMFRELVAAKFCSNHGDNPHTSGSLQVSSCWDNIVFNFSHPIADSLTSATWTLKTPVTRGEIVGPVEGGIPAHWWQPRININNRVSFSSLCEPFDITLLGIVDRRPVVNFPVTLAVGPRLIAQGPTRPDGAITIIGAHVGDRVWAGIWVNVIARPSLGPNVCGLPGF